MMLGSWEDFKVQCAQQAFDNLAPGGYFEAHDLDPRIRCNDETMPGDWDLLMHFEDIIEVTAAGGRPLRVVHTYYDSLIEVGFKDVEERVYMFPVNGWPKKRQWKELGRLWEVNFLTGISAFSLGPLTRMRGLSAEQVHVCHWPTP
jgi:metalloendopeptidase OMA1, mitochondrial